MQSWAEEEFGEASLGDKRLNRRLIEVARTLGDKPTASIPSACGGWADTQATYRFFDQASEDKQNLGWEEVLTPHLVRTETRMGQHPVVLCIQDTTELDFEGKQTKGLGALSYEPQRGMYLHPTYAVTPEREPLGVLDAWMWAREPKGPSGKRPGPCESQRWIEGYERIAERAQFLPNTRLVYVADREADIREGRGQVLPFAPSCTIPMNINNKHRETSHVQTLTPEGPGSGLAFCPILYYPYEYQQQTQGDKPCPDPYAWNSRGRCITSLRAGIGVRISSMMMTTG